MTLKYEKRYFEGQINNLLYQALVDESGVSPVDIIPPWLSMLIYHLVHGSSSSET
jgi:hypothetical protein